MPVITKVRVSFISFEQNSSTEVIIKSPNVIGAIRTLPIMYIAYRQVSKSLYVKLLIKY